MKARILQRHGHMARELGEKIFIFGCEVIPGCLIKELDNSDYLARVVSNWHSQKRTRPIIKALIEAWLKCWMRVGVLYINRLCRFGNMPGNTFAPWHANLLVIKTESHNRPQLFLFGVNQKDTAAIGLHFLPRNLED